MSNLAPDRLTEKESGMRQMTINKVQIAPVNMCATLRRALGDAITYQRNHTRQSVKDYATARANEYEQALIEFGSREYAIVPGGTVAFMNSESNAVIPAADIAVILDALRIAGEMQLMRGLPKDTARFRSLSRKLGDR